MPKKESTQRKNLRKSSRKQQLQHCRAMKKLAASREEEPLPESEEIASPLPASHPIGEEIQRKDSASKRKLAYCSTEQTPQGKSTSKLPKCFVDMNVFQHLFYNLPCPECNMFTLQLEEDHKRAKGLALCFAISCSECSYNSSSVMTSEKLGSYAYDVNRRFVGGMLNAGLGHGGAETFCNIMGIKGISHNSFNEHVSDIHSCSKDFSVGQLDKAIETVRGIHGASQTDILDIAVSFDGSWHKRGHTSKHGIGAVIELETGLVIDYHVLSSYCQTCATTGKDVEAKDYDAWLAKHQPDCCKNYTGSAGGMEVAAAKVLWGRSLSKNLRYTTLISDGDSKTLTELNTLSPYNNTEIMKEECVNHVSKRLGTALRNVVSTEKKRGVTLGGSKCGSLTQTKMTLLQKYYKNAVISKNATAVELSNKIWASFFHSTSSDAEPAHHLCPKGSDSWCFYNKALAKGDMLPSHEAKSKTFLNATVAKYVKPIYERLTDKKLLDKCMKGLTQNPNESFHAVVWARCPKHIFVSSKRVAIATALAVADFNRGSMGILEFSQAIGCAISNTTVRQGARRDQLRVTKAERSELAECKRRRAKRKFENFNLESSLANAEGHLYLAGAADD